MSKLYSRTFGAVPEEVEHDQRVYEKVQLLQQFIRPEHLDILPKFQNETSWLVRIFCSHCSVHEKLSFIYSFFLIPGNDFLDFSSLVPPAKSYTIFILFSLFCSWPKRRFKTLIHISILVKSLRVFSIAAKL